MERKTEKKKRKDAEEQRSREENEQKNKNLDLSKTQEIEFNEKINLVAEKTTFHSLSSIIGKDMRAQFRYFICTEINQKNCMLTQF
jgi:hypothetical protein